MKKVVEHLKSLLRVDSTTKQSPLAFLHTYVRTHARTHGTASIGTSTAHYFTTPSLIPTFV